jgi:hypothetical protein
MLDSLFGEYPEWMTDGTLSNYEVFQQFLASAEMYAYVTGRSISDVLREWSSQSHRRVELTTNWLRLQKLNQQFIEDYWTDVALGAS